MSAYALFDRIDDLREQLADHWVKELPTDTLTRLAAEGSVLAMEFVETPFIHPYFTERDQLVELLVTLRFLLGSDAERGFEDHIVCLLNLFREEVEFTWRPSSPDDFLLSVSW